MIFKLHQNCLPQIKAVLKEYGVCYIHGDGNLYITQEKSDFRKDFSNPSNEESTYRVKFVTGDKIPGNVEELQKMMLENRNQEILKERTNVYTSNVKTFTVEPEEVEPEEVEATEDKPKRGPKATK